MTNLAVWHGDGLSAGSWTGAVGSAADESGFANWTATKGGSSTLAVSTSTVRTAGTSPVLASTQAASQTVYARATYLTTTNTAGRFYLYAASQGLASPLLFGEYNDTGQILWRVRWQATNAASPSKLQVVANDGNSKGTSDNVFTASNWWRIEWNRSGLSIEIRGFNENTHVDYTGTPDLTITGVLTAPGSGSSAAADFRIGALSTTTAPNARWDDVLITDSVASWIGPYTAGDTSVSPAAAVATGAATNPTVQTSADATVSPAAAGAIAAVTSPGVIGNTNIAYAAAYSSEDTNNKRYFDIYYPSGTAPAGGWPTVFWVHGGYFNAGDKGDLATDGPTTKAAILAAGWAIVTPNYRLAPDPPTGSTSSSLTRFPKQVWDIKLCARYLADNSATWNVNASLFVFCGHSAGGSLALMAGYTANSNSSTTVTAFNTSGTNGTTSVDLTLSSQYSKTDVVPVGVAAWEAPIDFNYSKQFDVGVIYENAVRGYIGAPAWPTGTYGSSWDNPVDIAHTDGTSSFVTSGDPASWYCFSSGGSTNTFIPTSNTAGVSTNGHGYFLKQACSSASVAFTEVMATGSSHATIPNYGSTEFVNFLNGLTGTAVNPAAAVGAASVTGPGVTTGATVGPAGAVALARVTSPDVAAGGDTTASPSAASATGVVTGPGVTTGATVGPAGAVALARVTSPAAADTSLYVGPTDRTGKRRRPDSRRRTRRPRD